MADLRQYDFDASRVEPSAPGGLIPKGKYAAVIYQCELKQGKNPGASYFNIGCQIIEGKYAKRKVFGMITWTNRNADAEDIGRSQFSAICHAVGVLKPSDTADLHNKPLKITVGVEREKGYDDKNRIYGYEKLGGPAPDYEPPSQDASMTDSEMRGVSDDISGDDVPF